MSKRKNLPHRNAQRKYLLDGGPFKGSKLWLTPSLGGTAAMRVGVARGSYRIVCDAARRRLAKWVPG